MTAPKNCWEVKQRGRQPGGDKAEELGICPAALESKHDAKNRGVNGGRFCWAIAGTLCGGKVQGLFAMKIESCILCPFLQQVEAEEGQRFVLHPEQELCETSVVDSKK